MRRLSFLLLVASLASVLGTTAPASACGGFFCNAASPVNQAGEEIVYGVESDGSLVMSVRIAYSGTAPEFGWILPVPVTPTIELGTGVLFDALDGTTEPRFDIVRMVSGTCADTPACVFPPRDGGIYQDASAPLSDAGGPTIYSMGDLGPFETVVLSAATGADVQMWLEMHGYNVAASAIPLLDAYLARGDRFVALRLRTDVTVAELQPITLRMPMTAPCLPIRLTAVATQPELPITAYFLADHRATSTNFSMLDQPDDETLFLGTTSYRAWVTRAVAATTDGHAFATDFAGATPPIPDLRLPSVLDLASSTDVSTLLATLQTRGYRGDPQLLALLTRFVVPPAGMDPRSYFNGCFFGSCPTPMSFDPAGLVMAIDLAITQPRAAAMTLLGAHPYTTRLSTVMTAAQMTLDPEFRIDAALTDVARVRTATRVIECTPGVYESEAGSHLVLPSGRSAYAMGARPHQSPTDYCASLGGALPEVGLPDAAVVFDDVGPPRMDAGSVTPTGGGGGCAVGGRASSAALAVAVAAMALAARRRARRA